MIAIESDLLLEAVTTIIDLDKAKVHTKLVTRLLAKVGITGGARGTEHGDVPCFGERDLDLSVCMTCSSAYWCGQITPEKEKVAG
jgi:hypothetical protein